MPTLNSDIKGESFGIRYTENNEKWKIAKNTVIKVDQDAISGDSIGNISLFNNGTVSGERAIHFTDILDNLIIKNNSQGILKGNIYCDVYSGKINFGNKGSIKAKFGDAVFLRADEGLSFSNTGKITGDNTAVRVGLSDLLTQDAKFKNKGILKSDGVAVAIEGGHGNVVKMSNQKGAVIDGGPTAVYSEESIVLKNKGQIDGGLRFTGDHADKVVNKGMIKGDVLLGDGDDSFAFKGKGALKGGLIDGAEGNDTITLGKGAQKVLIDFDIYGDHWDFIKKFESGSDKILLDEDRFQFDQTGKLANSQFKTVKNLDFGEPQSFDGIIYDKSTGFLFYSNAGDYPYGFARLDPGTKLKASDFRIGEYSIDI